MFTTKGPTAIIFAALLAILFASHTVARAGQDDVQWTDRERAVLESLWLGSLPAPPHDPSNTYADNPRAAAFGKRLFFEKGLSANGTLACASCHEADKALTDGRKLAHGMGDVARNAPSLFDAPYLPWLYWDGRRDSLWAQALTPFEAPNEMGTTRTAVIRHILATPELSEDYISVFGPFDPHLLTTIGHMEGGPFGTPAQKAAWKRSPERDRRAINHAFANVGKAIAAFERTLKHTPSRFDRYAEAIIAGRKPMGTAMLSTGEIAGLKLFLNEPRTRCLRCHNGPLFTNYEFHNVGTGTFEGPNLDYGRMFGIHAAQTDEFNCLGPYSDARPGACYELKFLEGADHSGALLGAFKVPGLRNAARTGPYMHDGRFDTLKEVMEHYRTPNAQPNTNHELLGVNFSDEEIDQLISFLKTLTDSRLSEN